ncbi:UbiA family prenyltransferase [uncultured Thiothrix sp.]|uniref:UbiA family prenyltransferase n=1 Tax=uncultured Thiothrix sp. TaxID=223185 RepID=UPI00260420A7|nr:UbiA family prenyltransferase [uncultured Thiothrix sp.]
MPLPDNLSKILVVDLDGTLLKSDILIENVLIFIKKHPLKIYQLFFWLLRGKIELKRKLAEKIDIDVTQLPYNNEVLSLINQRKQLGHKIILATATYKKYAILIADFLKFFDDTIYSETDNLSGKNKAKRLNQLFGYKKYDYVGNSFKDISIWKSSLISYVVPSEIGLKALIHFFINGNIIFLSKNHNPIKSWLKELRIHQWVKNILIFIPLITSHQLTNINLILNGIIAFFLFSICASSVYILNDLLDLNEDRQHINKKNRPFASGDLNIKYGLFLFPFFLFLSFYFSYRLLPEKFFLSMVLYYIITFLYSFYLKKVVLIDVIVLASLYTIRIIAGAFAFQLNLTFWLLAFSMFIFLSLALIKRYTELKDSKNSGKTNAGRGYCVDDLELISSLGSAAGYISVLVLALYIDDINTVKLYTYPQLIWLACPLLLFWISRVWLLAHRGQMHEDPIVFTIKDKPSILIGLLFILVLWYAA